MRQTIADIWAGVGWERKIAAFFGGVLVLALTGPFGTYQEMSFAERVIFWVIVLTAAGFFMHILVTTAMASRHLAKLPGVVRIGIGAALAGLPGAAVVIFVHGVFRPPLSLADELPLIWVQVALICWVLGIVEFHDFGTPEDRTTPPRRTALHKRLPPELGDEIISISMQDHYAEVTTTLGSYMILIRLTDAMQELDAIPGLRVHRSHYVTTAHLRKLRRDGGRLRVVLSDGRDLPVSASYVDAVRAALRERGNL